MTHEEYSKKVTKLFEKYIDYQQTSQELPCPITDEAINDLLKLKQKAGIK